MFTRRRRFKGRGEREDRYRLYRRTSYLILILRYLLLHLLLHNKCGRYLTLIPLLNVNIIHVTHHHHIPRLHRMRLLHNHKHNYFPRLSGDVRKSDQVGTKRLVLNRPHPLAATQDQFPSQIPGTALEVDPQRTPRLCLWL